MFTLHKSPHRLQNRFCLTANPVRLLYANYSFSVTLLRHLCSKMFTPTAADVNVVFYLDPSELVDIWLGCR